MRRIAAVLVGVSTLSAGWAAAWSGAWQPLRASYIIYSGELAERSAPTASDRTMTINVEGRAAKEMFESIGPDLAQTCSQEKGDRERGKQGVSCQYSAQDKVYRCWIGLNLRTGASVPTVSC